MFGEKEKQIQIAVGRICRLTDQTCEFAILVADRWQKRGIGSYLLEKLKSEALLRKFSKIQGYILSYNSQMISLAKAHGFKIESVPKDKLVLAVYTFNK